MDRTPIPPDADTKELKAATHAAFVAMLGCFKVDEAVELVLKNHDDMLTAVLEDVYDRTQWGERRSRQGR